MCNELCTNGFNISKTMKKEIKQIKTIDNKEYVQLTFPDERWYVRGTIDELNGKLENEFVPSVSWISGFYPKGIAFYKWLADKGWNEAEALKSSAGNKGSKIHQAIEDLLKGKEVKMDEKFLNKETLQEEELTVDEYEAIMSFVDWYNETNPEIVGTEQVVFNDEYGYAGTVDLICRIGDQLYIIDFKTGQSIWPEYELQISAYKHAVNLSEDIKLAILQVGYRKNKKLFKFTEIEDKFDLFLSAKNIWQNECANIKPKQKDYPTSLKVVVNKKKEIKK